MQRLALMLSVCLLLIAAGTAFAQDLQISSLMQKKQHHEVIRILQQKLDRKEKVSSFLLFLMAAACSEVRDYEKMRMATDLLEKQIRAGDRSYFSGDLTPYPAILRGFAALDQGDIPRVLQVAGEAERYLRGSKENMFLRSQTINVADLLGVAHALLKRDAEADRYLSLLQGLQISDTNLGPEKYLAIARIHMARRQFDKALSAVRNPEAKVSAALTAFYDQTFQELPKQFIFTKCLFETGKIPEARRGYDQLLKHPQIKEIGGLYWLILLDRARIARMDGDLPLAERLLREAVEVLERQRSSIHSEAGRIGYVGDKQAVYQELIALLAAGNRAAEAFEYTERAKGRALVDLLANQRLVGARTPNAAKVQETLDRLATTEKGLGIVKAPEAAADSPQTRGILVALKNELASQAPELASLVTVSPVSLGGIQASLPPQETLLEYYAAKEDWYVFVVRRGSILCRSFPVPHLEEEVLAFREALTHPDSQDYLPLSRKLYKWLFAPVADLIPPGRLTIVPHGILHYLPFGALSSGTQVLIDLYDLRMLPSASVLKYLKGRSGRGGRRALILGNPDLGDPRLDLKHAEEEAQAIAGILPEARLLVRGEARAGVVRSAGGDYDILHVAAHGLFVPTDPLSSALLLAKDPGSDGLLRAGDLYHLNLDADLVTLSACQTALAKVATGDDVLGFTRGFLYAGARSIVSSLWSVDDLATRDLMIALYQRLSTLGKDSALRQAQLEVRKKHPHPYYWAAFQVTGLVQ